MRASRSGLLVGAAALFGVALIGAGFATYRAVGEASATLARGRADLLHDELRVAIGRGVPTQEELDSLLLAYADDQVTYIAIADATGGSDLDGGTRRAPPDGGKGRKPFPMKASSVVVAAGQSAWATPPADAGRGAMTIIRLGDRMRATYRRGLRPRMAARIGASTATQLVFEFVPSQADELEQRATRSGVFAVVGALLAVLLALLYAAQRRRADAALRKEEQSRRLAALGEMSAVLAHELRNPLASLKGHAQLLERALPNGEALHDKAVRVVSEAVRLERLSNDLLTFVKTGDLNRTPTDLAQLAREVVDDRGQGRATLLVEGTPAHVSIDRERVRQVLVNLVDNAVQAGDTEIEVTVRAGKTDVELVVRDHGAGIAQADLPRLFQPFFTTKTQGTGLGLSIARQITELHGGTIEAGQAEGGGARFVVRIPRGAG